MNNRFWLVSLLTLGMISCSSNNNTNEEGSSDVAVESEESVLQEETSENSDSSDSSDEFVEESADSSTDSSEGTEDSVVASSEASSASIDETVEVENESNLTEVEEEAPTVKNEGAVSEDAKFAYYQVQKGDSLMLVSFKVYGDYRKWKKIYHLNESTLKNNTELSSGMNLKYEVSEDKFTWNPEGNPYLIKTDDTLGKISNEVYKKPIYWRYIYDNNRPLIRNPNLIFAGFTLYYKELTDEVIKNSRTLSSKKK